MLNKYENGKLVSTFTNVLMESVLKICHEYVPTIAELEESLDRIKLELKNKQLFVRNIDRFMFTTNGNSYISNF